MPNKVLKDSIDIIAPMLRDIFNLSIMTNDDLKILKVVAVHKAGDIYRGSLLLKIYSSSTYYSSCL